MNSLLIHAQSLCHPVLGMPRRFMQNIHFLDDESYEHFKKIQLLILYDNMENLNR